MKWNYRNNTENVPECSWTFKLSSTCPPTPSLSLKPLWGNPHCLCWMMTAVFQSTSRHCSDNQLLLPLWVQPVGWCWWASVPGSTADTREGKSLATMPPLLPTHLQVSWNEMYCIAIIFLPENNSSILMFKHKSQVDRVLVVRIYSVWHCCSTENSKEIWVQEHKKYLQY